MLIDARTIPNNHALETDICIVGAGAAGITLALQFAGQPFRVCLLESGGLERDEGAQSLYRGENIGLPYFPLQIPRLRYFGGTTNHWAGMCRPFADIDFEAREWIPYSGWPFRKSAIDPFYERALSICQLRSSQWDLASWGEADKPTLAFVGDRVLTEVGQQAPDGLRQFGRTYRDEVIRAQNIATYLHANVIELEADETLRSITCVRVACLSGKTFSVEAKLFILAAGGIENARLLLLSNKRQSAGLGNQNDLVGRFFLEHPSVRAGIFRLSNQHIPVKFYQMHKVKESIVGGGLVLSAEVRRREQLVTVGVGLDPVYDEAHRRALESKGVRSLRSLLKALWNRDIPDEFGKHVGNVITDIGNVAVAAYGQLRFRGDNPPDHIRLTAVIDPAPNPDSRVTLTPKLDQLGKNRVQLDWRLSPIDKRSVRRTLEIIGVELGRAGIGRLQIGLDDDDTRWPADLGASSHHMGTTRMHDNPKLGVVDKNCQVHGIANLFIAGSSVFPTAGSGTPTLMIVALALRLADHIQGKLR